MTFEEFIGSLSQPMAPGSLPPLLQALWHDGKGDWHAAHEIAQVANSPDHCWLHAYLHRKEGDQWNADYWYRRAGRSLPAVSLHAEWEDLVRTQLKQVRSSG